MNCTPPQIPHRSLLLTASSRQSVFTGHVSQIRIALLATRELSLNHQDGFAAPSLIAVTHAASLCHLPSVCTLSIFFQAVAADTKLVQSHVEFAEMFSAFLVGEGRVRDVRCGLPGREPVDAMRDLGCFEDSFHVDAAFDVDLGECFFTACDPCESRGECRSGEILCFGDDSPCEQ